MNEEYFTFHPQYKHCGTFANRKCEEKTKKTKKNMAGTCQVTNLESLESLNNIYPRSFHSVVWKEKKINS